MADQEWVETLQDWEEGGVDTWNVYVTYGDGSEKAPDLSGADLSGIDLSYIWFVDTNLRKANLRQTAMRHANLTGSDLRGADLRECGLDYAEVEDADLRKADLREVNLHGARLNESDLSGADLRGANLSWANLTEVNLKGCRLEGATLENAQLLGTNLSGARLNGAKLENAHFVETDLSGADLTNCTVYGVATWDLKLEKTKQLNLIITRRDEPSIAVDNLEVAQFVYLLLGNRKIRGVIDTVTSKVVLILGRFTRERKLVLDSLRDALRALGYVPILFDFEPSQKRDLTETIQVLANMAKFVIADLTDAKSIPQELSAIVPHLPSVPIQPVILASQKEYAMFEHWRQYPWVLPEYRYRSSRDLLKNLEDRVVGPAANWAGPEQDAHALKAENEELKRQLAELQGARRSSPRLTSPSGRGGRRSGRR